MSLSTSLSPVLAPSRILPVLTDSLRANAPLWVLLAFYWAVNLAIVWQVPEINKTPSTSDQIVLLLGGTYFFLYLVGRTIHLALTGNKAPLHALANEIFDLKRFLNGFHVIFAFIPFIALFSEIKVAIPYLQPFAWDMAFYQADLVLHGGVLPHEWLSPLLAWPRVMSGINFAYHLWFFIMWALLLAFAFQREASALRMRYLLSFFGLWIIAGSFAAIAFSSAGPCYFGLIGLSPDPYAGLMRALHQIHAVEPLMALDLQARLWEGYEDKHFDHGISAMPSLHNATSILFALVCFRVNRWLGWAFSLFALIIAVGSVILGWHYAVDAYVGWMITYAIWKAMGPISRRLTTQGALP